MTIVQKALIKDLQESLNDIKSMNQECNIIGSLQVLKKDIDLTIKLINKENTNI